jgi:hypothetical protein
VEEATDENREGQERATGEGTTREPETGEVETNNVKFKAHIVKQMQDQKADMKEKNLMRERKISKDC